MPHTRKNILEEIKSIQDTTRHEFNNRERKCNNPKCDYWGKLIESHLIYSNNIRLLGKGKKTKVIDNIRKRE